MFPKQVKVQVVPMGGTELIPDRWHDQYYYEALNYVEMDDLRYGDLNNLIKKASTYDIQINIYITYDYESHKSSHFHDEDEFRNSDIPDIGLVFEKGRYTGFGLGDGPFGQVIAETFNPYKHTSTNWDQLLIKAINEACKEVDINNAADEL